MTALFMHVVFQSHGHPHRPHECPEVNSSDSGKSRDLTYTTGPAVDGQLGAQHDITTRLTYLCVSSEPVRRSRLPQ